MRRTFLALPLIALFCLSAACSGGSSSSASPTKFPTSSDPAKQVATPKPVNIVMAGADWYVGQNNFVIGVTNGKDEPQGGATVKLTFYDLRGKDPKPVSGGEAVASAPGVGPKILSTHADGEQHYHGGEDEGRAGYYITVNFDHAGSWGVLAEVTLKDGATKGQDNFAFQVSEKPKMPALGQKALKSDNLTRKDVKDIKEIDSGVPANDMHDVKIKDAIAAGRPLVVVFATPAFCTSRFCGPVTNEVEALQAIYREKVDFVHIEIWRDFDKKVINPTAKEWLVQPDGSLTEPIVYVIDKNGTIYDRWEGPAAKNIIEPAVKAVAEGSVR